MAELLLRNRLNSKEDQDMFPTGYVLCTKLSINEKKTVSRKLLVLQIPQSITALMFIMCLLLARKTKNGEIS